MGYMSSTLRICLLRCTSDSHAFIPSDSFDVMYLWFTRFFTMVLLSASCSCVRKKLRACSLVISPGMPGMKLLLSLMAGGSAPVGWIDE